MSKYIMRLDDAAEKMNIEKWIRMERLLDKYNVKPLVGVIPDCKDPEMEQYTCDDNFWSRVQGWMSKGWIIALHGYEHIYCTEEGGINPVNKRSEFAGVPLDEQKKKIKNGVKIFKEHGIIPKIFFAPSHTFDKNTIKALKEESDIVVISDTIANDVYFSKGIYFIPQQSGHCRKLPFKIVSFCYHPNIMTGVDFKILECFLKKSHSDFIVADDKILKKRCKGIFDCFLSSIYFARCKCKCYLTR
ncbi:MAG: DUF2334 domain-containing protein [Lachnospiraceae bacterium]